MQKFTSEEHAKFKAADPDDVVCVRVGQIAVLIEQNEQLLAKDVRSEEEKAEYRSKNAVLEQRISDLNRSSKLNSHNSSKPPSSDGLLKETVEKKKEKAQFAFCMQTCVPLINRNRIKQMRQNQEVFATDHNQFQDRLSGIDGLSPE